MVHRHRGYQSSLVRPAFARRVAVFAAMHLVQFGWMNQWTDPRGIGTFFGAGSLVDDNGNAQIPDHWKAAWKWTYDGWWKDWFIPNGPYGGADFLQGPGGPFSSGNLAMIHIHMWYVAPWALGNVDFDWNLAATPSYNGTITAKMHADTFGILKGCPTPDEAFAVLTYMLSKEHVSELLIIYGGIPARLSLQSDYFSQYVTLIPTYVVFLQIGWLGTWLPLIVPAFFSWGTNVFLLRQFFLSIPCDPEEAAMIDGASPIRIFYSIVLVYRVLHLTHLTHLRVRDRL